jgi:hypothetical protein
MVMAVASPALLGPGVMRVLVDLGTHAHVCKCGMRAGTCGCPECERLEKLRTADERPCPVPAMRRQCDDPPAFAPSAPWVAVPTWGVRLSPIPVLGEQTPAFSALPHADPVLDPPTPPPRIAAT